MSNETVLARVVISVVAVALMSVVALLSIAGSDTCQSRHVFCTSQSVSR